MASITPSNSEASSNSETVNYRFPFIVVTAIFFLFGFITVVNDILVPKFKDDFGLEQWQSNLVQSAFFGAFFLVSLVYFIISVTKGDPINRLGYKNGLVIGLVTTVAGSLLMWPASNMGTYPLFLGALFIIGTGVTFLQISANPYVSVLGAESSAAMRLNLSQGFNSLGTVLAPLVASLLIYGTLDTRDVNEEGSVKSLYIILAIVFGAMAVAIKFIKLPTIHQTAEAPRGIRVFRHRHFPWGMAAIFCYVGCEVTLGTILIDYLRDENVLGLTKEESGKYVAFYWGGAMIGRLVGAISLSGLSQSRKVVFMLGAALISTCIIFATASFKEYLNSGQKLGMDSLWPFLILIGLNFLFFYLGKAKPNRMVGLFSAVAAGLVAVCIVAPGNIALWAFIGVGLFNSIMWSNIFTLSIRGLGNDTGQGSSLLVMMIVGGAIMPPVQGLLMKVDFMSIRLSLVLILLGYLYLLFFGFVASQFGLNKQQAAESSV